MSIVIRNSPLWMMVGGKALQYLDAANNTDGQVLVISPVIDDVHRDKFKKALESTNRKYGQALKHLAE